MAQAAGASAWKLGLSSWFPPIFMRMFATKALACATESVVCSRSRKAGKALKMKFSSISIDGRMSMKGMGRPDRAQYRLGDPLESIKINYPKRDLSLFGWNIHWMILFFVFCMVFAFALKGVVGVEI